MSDLAQYKSGELEPTVSRGLIEIWDEAERVATYSSPALFVQHLIRSAKNAAVSPFTALASTLTATLAFAVFSFFALMLAQIGAAFERAQSDLELSIYLAEQADPAKIEALKGEIQGRPEVDKVHYRSKEEALRAFRVSLGKDAVILEGLESSNPLPASFEVRLKKELTHADNFRALAKSYEKNPLVERVEYGQSLLSNLSEYYETFRLGSTFAIVIILLVTGFIIANTIRLALYVHRDEIEIMQLVGANRLFIGAPFLIEGAVEGMLGASLGLLLLGGAVSTLNQVIAESSFLSVVMPPLTFLSGWAILAIVLLGFCVGLIGSAGALRRFLQ